MSFSFLFSFCGGQGGFKEYFIHSVRLSTLYVELKKKSGETWPCKNLFFQRLGTSTWVVLLIRSAVVPTAVIHKDTPLLHTPSSLCAWCTCFFKIFFIKVRQSGGFPQQNSSSFWHYASFFPRYLKRREEFRTVSFRSWLMQGWRGGFQSDTHHDDV